VRKWDIFVEVSCDGVAKYEPKRRKSRLFFLRVLRVVRFSEFFEIDCATEGNLFLCVFVWHLLIANKRRVTYMCVNKKKLFSHYSLFVRLLHRALTDYINSLSMKQARLLSAIFPILL
jgi:hypothetical protein